MLYETEVLSKNLLQNKKYKLVLTTESLIFYKLPEILKHRYIISLRMNSQVSWIVKYNVPVGITIIQKLKSKSFYGQDLSVLKNKLAMRVSFNPISAFYDLKQTLGKGSSAKVVYATEKATGKEYAIKILNKKNFKPIIVAALETEISILKALKHSQHFTQIYEFYQNDQEFFIVLSLMRGKSLTQILSSHLRLSKETICDIMKGLLQGINYMHQAGVIHRDLKPDNIMFEVEHDYSSVVLCDFGLATFEQEKFLFYKCGTPGYVAPEVLNQFQKETYSNACDLFSAGCIMFKLLTGKNLFQGRTWDEVLNLNKKCDLDVVDDIKDYISKDEYGLLTKLLHLDPLQRITAKEALELDYFDQSDLNQSISEEGYNQKVLVNKMPKILHWVKEQEPNICTKIFYMKNALSSLQMKFDPRQFFSPQNSPKNHSKKRSIFQNQFI